MGVLRAPSSGVTVRMYRQDFGSGFLLAFPTDQPGKPFYLLLDGGAPGSKRSADVVTRVAGEISAATSGEIHLLVATDGYREASPGTRWADLLAQRLRVHRIWLPWTEDPADRLAQRARMALQRDRTALRRVLSRSADRQALQPVAELLGFADDDSSPAERDAGDRTWLEEEAPAQAAPGVAARPRAGAAARWYLRAGDGPIDLAVQHAPRVPHVRVYVLEPPRDGDGHAGLSAGAAGTGAVGGVAALTERTALMLALRDHDDLTPDELELRELCFPFNREVRMSRRQAEGDAFFQRHYGFGSRPDSDWRRIDHDWQGLSLRIARQMAQDVGQSSLALAIELVNTRRFLLFARGGQLGAWLDRDEVNWSLPDETGNSRDIRTSALLRRTKLYMLGDHDLGSSTPAGSDRDRLAAMLTTSHDLVALLPTGRTAHPTAVRSDPLLRRLEEKAAWRLLRSDETFPRRGPAGVSGAEWRAFKARFEETPAYRQYTVTDEPG